LAITLTIRVGEALQIGDDTVIRIDQKSGQQVKVSVSSPRGPVVGLKGALAPARSGELLPKRYTTGISGRLKPA
jgi:hypothetical protein